MAIENRECACSASAGTHTSFPMDRADRGGATSARGPGTLRVDVDGDGALFLLGELDIGTIQDLQDKIDDVLVPGVAIVLDMAQLTFLDSSAIHLFIKTCQVTGHRVVLRNASPFVRRTLGLVDARAKPEAWIFDGA